MPSFWSAVANMAWNRRRSKRMPSASETSSARLMVSFVIMAMGSDMAAMVSAVFRASARRSASGTTRATRPERSASSASIMRPVRHISMALALPMSRVRRCVPPMPGMTPSLISGWPNLALSAAMMKSHIMASSQPPPSAKPATAAIIGLRRPATCSQPEKRSSM